MSFFFSNNMYVVIMASSAIPSVVPPQPIAGQGAQGAKGHRPSEKRIESKDVVKIFGEGAAFGKRISMPRGMISGGGSADYAARSSLNQIYIKALAWATTYPVAAADQASLVMRGTGLLGPLAPLSAAADSAASPGLLQYQSGAPINVAAIRRSQGSYVYKQDALISYEIATGGTLNILGTVTAASNAAEMYYEMKILTDTTPDYDTKFPINANIRIERWIRFAPDLVASGAGLSKSIDVYEDYRLTFETKTAADDQKAGSVAVAGTTRVVAYRHYYTLALTTETLLYVNLYSYSTTAVTGASYIITLLDSRGSTLAGHDGLPFDGVPASS